jgi:SHS family lactate transporter-like MFS transporter
MTPAQTRTFIAAFLGWTLDAFDFFLLTFVLTNIALDFHKTVADITVAITLTLMMRPVGALLFGWLGDRFGRRLPLMINVACFSAIALATAFAPSYAIFLIVRALYGVAMGGEWGLGAALAMESLPLERRGLFSGILQEGYMVGFLLAAATYGLVFTYTPWGWRSLFVIGVLPALLIVYIRSTVPESPSWLADRAAQRNDPREIWRALVARWPLFLYVVLLMAAFNFMSHGTQDLYATFLRSHAGFNPAKASQIAIVAAVGAILGGISFGSISQWIGRRVAILIAAGFAITLIPLWAFSQTFALLAAGGFAMQFMVQGAWGTIPAHLNELSPGNARGIFPGFTYQLGNLIAAGAVQIEATLAATRFVLPDGRPGYASALAVTTLLALASVIVFTVVGYFVSPERRTASFTALSS